MIRCDFPCLRRIADQVPVSNSFPAFAPLGSRLADRHLFREYPSARGKTLFLPKDRLYLTRLIIDDVFDFSVFKEHGIVEAIFPLHEASSGERVTRDSLAKVWLSPWHNGSPFVSFEVAPWYMKPWAQPLDDIREYFGETVALYFAWLGFYSYSLLFPVLLGILLELSSTHHDLSIDKPRGLFVGLAFAVSISFWATYYKASWEGEQRVCQAKWGTRDFEKSEQASRSMFHGDTTEPWYISMFFGCPQKPQPPRRLSEVSLQQETWYPPEKRRVKVLLSWGVLTGAVAALCVVYGTLGFVEYFLVARDGRGKSGMFLTTAIAAVLVPVANSLFRPWVETSTHWENHQVCFISLVFFCPRESDTSIFINRRSRSTRMPRSRKHFFSRWSTTMASSSSPPLRRRAFLGAQTATASRTCGSI